MSGILGGALRPFALASGGLLLGISATLLVTGAGHPDLPPEVPPTVAAQAQVGPLVEAPGATVRPSASVKTTPHAPRPAHALPRAKPSLEPIHIQPVQVAIPDIKVKSPLVGLGLNADGSLEVPTDSSRAGWFSRGPAPGDNTGPPAVIVGHIDSRTGPAVFYRLRELHKGSDVFVNRIDGSVLRFRVYRIESYPKVGFPDAQVYGASSQSELRLITCSGSFDSTREGYQDNLVAYASLVGHA